MVPATIVEVAGVAVSLSVDVGPGVTTGVGPKVDGERGRAAGGDQRDDDGQHEEARTHGP
jgi:hypothetical protein